jgi:hypothetical protein
MRTYSLSISLAALLGIAILAAPLAHAAGEVTVYGIRHEPIGEIGKFVDGSWGGGAEALFDQPKRHPGLSFGIGGDFVSLHSQARDADYFRIFSGARLRFLNERMLRPYVDAHLSLVRHSLTGTLAAPAFRSWGAGYDAGVGLHLNPFDRMTGFVGLRYLQSFGLQGEGANSDIKINPQYWNAYGGIAWTFGFLEVAEGG